MVVHGMFKPFSVVDSIGALSPVAQDRVARLVAALLQAEAHQEMIASAQAPRCAESALDTPIPTAVRSVLRLIKGSDS
jgi:hypothetical protein